MKTICVTGVLGFIFSNFMELMSKKYPEYRFVGIDKAIKDYNLASIVEYPNYKFYLADIGDQHIIDSIFKIEKPDIIIHGAAESFVDDSIKDIKPFLHSNVMGTQCMVNAALQHNVDKFIYISTDEVYGQLKLGDDSWTENSSTLPRNPYSASKLSGELIVRAAGETHGLKYNITRCSNNYGPRQPPRNLIPKVITCLINDQEIPIHGSGEQLREWIFVSDHNDAVMTVLKNGVNKEIYNIGSGFELKNLDIVKHISNIMNVDPKIKHIKDRPGHDFRYSVNCNKIKELGWEPKFSNFDFGIETTVRWYIENKDFYK